MLIPVLRLVALSAAVPPCFLDMAGADVDAFVSNVTGAVVTFADDDDNVVARADVDDANIVDASIVFAPSDMSISVYVERDGIDEHTECVDEVVLVAARVLDAIAAAVNVERARLNLAPVDFRL